MSYKHLRNFYLLGSKVNSNLIRIMQYGRLNMSLLHLLREDEWHVVCIINFTFTLYHLRYVVYVYL